MYIYGKINKTIKGYGRMALNLYGKIECGEWQCYLRCVLFVDTVQLKHKIDTFIVIT